MLEARCRFLDRLSSSNRALRAVVRALAALEAAKTAGSAIPIAGQIAAVLGEAPAEALRATARGIASYQDGLIQLDVVAGLAALSCGPGLSIAKRTPYTRNPTFESTLAGAPAPLAWNEGPATSELDVRSWDLATRSFGYCHPERPGSQLLDGESYEVRFRLIGGARPPSKPWSFWQ